MSKPVLLVHGAWAGAWAWGNVIEELQGRGVQATAIDLPSGAASGTVAEDSKAVRAALDGLDGPAVLVGHSYAGMVITDASADNDRVAQLVYVCAALPEQGESVQDLMGADPHPSGVGDAMRMADDGTATVTREGAHDFIFNDATDEQVAPVLDALGSHAMSTFGETASGLGWEQHPSTYVVTLQDRIFSPELQRRLAGRAGSAIVEVDSGHGPMLTQVPALADAIATAARD